MRREQLYLTDIVDAIDAIARFLSNADAVTFSTNELLQSAVLHKLTVIGESASRISPELRQRNPEVEWRAIIGFRNILVHEYFAVDHAIVWETATREVAVLRDQISAILDSL
ncbi:MAG: DUF86 domain-containing protein, partial [Holophagales bacterium]|nr:DUF86 domain-containing protein [Holophagales bacterium]